MIWLVLFTVIPAYAVLAMAFGKENFLLQPQPAWNPGTWNVGFLFQAISGAVPGGEFWPSVRNTIRLRRRLPGAVASRSAIRWPTTSRGTRTARSGS